MIRRTRWAIASHPAAANVRYGVAFNKADFFMFYHLLLSIHEESEERTKIIKYIYKTRLKILLDLHARNKAKIAAIMTYLGFDAVRYAFSFINKRK